jgi:hypothetical protein
MHEKSKIIYVIIFFLFCCSMSARMTQTDIRDEIETVLIAKNGDITSLGSITNVNSSKKVYRDRRLPIKDPYGTLENCYLFVASTKEGGLVGVYKDNILLWDSGPIIKNGVNSIILGTLDINNDGNVELIASWYYGMRNSYSRIWIFSWNGSSGTQINETVIYPSGYSKESVIFGYDYDMDILDVDGDGIFEIKGLDKKTRMIKIYSWNGSNYGDYGVILPEYVPMDLLTAKVTCNVKNSQYGLLYNYTIKNDSTSLQSIWRFAVERNSENSFINSGTPNEKWSQRYPSDVIKLIQWDVSEDLKHYPFDYVQPSVIKTNYKEETDAEMLMICNYYIQGKNGKKIYTEQYLTENSFIGKTICGIHPKDPFIPQDFLDTMKGYNSQSFDLGWIQNESTRNKYNTYFNNAQNYLQQRGNVSAIAELQNVLNECNSDSSTVLTSEAYALLYFNTEYLITQIKE